jgi:cell division septation protein DedD
MSFMLLLPRLSIRPTDTTRCRVISVRTAMSAQCRLVLQLRTYRCAALTDAAGQKGEAGLPKEEERGTWLRGPRRSRLSPGQTAVPSSANHWAARSGGHFIGQFRVYSFGGLNCSTRGIYVRGIIMSEQIKSQTISRRRLFWLAATAVVLGAPTSLIATSNASAQQATDQAPAAAEQTPPKKKKKKKKTAPAPSSAPAATPKAAPAEPKQQ